MKLKQVAIAPDTRKWRDAFAVQTFIKRLGASETERVLEARVPYLSFHSAYQELSTQRGEIEFTGIVIPGNPLLLGYENLKRPIDMLKVDPDKTSGKRGRKHNLAVLIMYDDSQILSGENVDEKQITRQRNLERVRIVKEAMKEYRALSMLIGDMYATRVPPEEIDPVIRNFLLSGQQIGPYRAHYQAARDYLNIFSSDKNLREKLETLTGKGSEATL